MIKLEDTIKDIRKRIDGISRYNNDYELYQSLLTHLEDYRDLLQLACKNSIDFDSYKIEVEYNERDKGLC